MAALNQAHLFLSGSSTIIASFERGLREGVNKDSCNTCGDVKTLLKAGHLKKALHILNQQDTSADSITYGSLLQECIKRKGLAEGKHVHAHMIQSGLKPNIFVLNTLVNMYAKCGSLEDARQVFDKMPERDVSTWNIMMAGYAKHGSGKETLKIYEQMIQEGLKPNKVSFICVLNACASLPALEKGKDIHADIVRAQITPDVILDTALLAMYAKGGSIRNACQVFDTMAHRNLVSWNAMITGYAQHGYAREAFDSYEQMIQEGVTPDKITFTCMLNACVSLADLVKGKEVHADIVKAGITSDVILDTAFITMYAKCGSIRDARHVFDSMAQRNVVSWNAMIAGYAQNGCHGEAFDSYEQMIREGVTPDKVTFTCVLNVCASLAFLEKGKEVHTEIMKAGIEPDIILDNTLVDMYAKCGSLKDARQVFNNMVQRDVVSWNAMIAGHVLYGFGKEAVDIYEQMIRKGVMPDKVTFTGILNACASMAALEKGKVVHANIMKAGILPDVSLNNALVDMYAKCGSVKDARRVFDGMAHRDVVSWNTMMTGYAQHGCGKEAIQLFEQIQQEGLKPDGITFTCLLSACSHVGLVDEGHYYFDSMSRDHGLTPTVEHFSCMVDLLGRAGQLEEAENCIIRTPIQTDARLWGSLLGACRNHGDLKRAERVAKCFIH